MRKFPSFFAFQEGIWETHMAALLSSPTVTHELGSPPRMKIAGLFSAEYPPVFYKQYWLRKKLEFFATAPCSHNTPRSHFIEECQAMRSISRLIGSYPMWASGIHPGCTVLVDLWYTGEHPSYTPTAKGPPVCHRSAKPQPKPHPKRYRISDGG